jgi:small subunit ribosomal protein S14
MAKKITLKRERNRQEITKKYYMLRIQLKKEFSKRSSLSERMEVHNKIQRLPRNRSPTRIRNRCQLSGRSRSYYRTFRLSRHFLRDLAHRAALPGLQKSSW